MFCDKFSVFVYVLGILNFAKYLTNDNVVPWRFFSHHKLISSVSLLQLKNLLEQFFILYLSFLIEYNHVKNYENGVISFQSYIIKSSEPKGVCDNTIFLD